MIKFSERITYGVLLFFSFMLLILYIIGASRYITDHEANTCGMTYMFEYPQYVRISLSEESEERFPRFSLYAYGEGFVTERNRRMSFSGIPVLFVPGNAGSHEQVRSIASVSLRKSLKDRTPFHFDFFTISFAEDYSALYGGLLAEHTEYVSRCTRRILELYGGKFGSVIVIGHSMGGIIAKGAFSLHPAASNNSVQIMITLATPHVPSLVLDSLTASYYRDIENSAYRLREMKASVVSIGGGPRDTMVPAAGTIDPAADISVLSTSIPDVWKTTDHLSILWCKELVLVIVRALFDCVESTKRSVQIIPDADRRMQILTYHLSRRYAGKHFHAYQEKVQFEPGGEWIENIQRQYVWESRTGNTSRAGATVYLMIRLIGPYDRLTIETLNFEARDWLFVCSASSVQGYSRVCDWGWNLTNETKISPSVMHRKRRSVDLDLSRLKGRGLTHVVLRIPPAELRKDIAVLLDVHSKSARTLRLANERSFLRTAFAVGKSDPLEFPRGNVRYYAEVPGAVNSLVVEVKSIDCAEESRHRYASVESIEPWNPGATQIRLFTERGKQKIRLQTARGRWKDSTAAVSLKITLNPSCSYTFEIERAGITEQISCAVRDRWPALYMISMSLLLLAVGWRIDGGQNGAATIVVTAIVSLGFGLGLETCVALAVLHVLGVIVCCAVIFFGSVVHNVAIRFLARTVTLSTTLSDWLLGTLIQFPLVLTVLVLSLVPVTCGALVMMISAIVYFLKLTRMYEDYLEELLMQCLRHFRIIKSRLPADQRDAVGEGERIRGKILDQLALFLLYCFAAIPAIPSILIWAKNFRYDARLTSEDPVLLTSWLILSGCNTLGLIEMPSSRCGYRSWILAFALRFMGWTVLCLIGTASESYHQWWMPSLTAAAVSFIAMNFIIPETRAV